ncbi:aminopeptidase I zinc metalloprotease-domain-containing protein [Durotheca rogersii]|uniref:aminopeptidase I zinc metalloprotease-domain-containing protein n=1 Tax=Durotheca rogersii TaxID=419775 RepID=UPI00221F8354|nr:aminopeptidase I zinc metalloprotease-domain-containing protein [Durotheca rogersii]KAI5867199.1 aminopeptidase I zinc metalloprotease-domain-containing protein [Durotheca rogersii]
MTRHTSESLRQRPSNMSLRTATAPATSSPLHTSQLSSFAHPSEFETVAAMSDAEKAFVVGELARHRSLTLCDSCYRDIADRRTKSLSFQLTSDRGSCSCCDVLASKPEAFTEPFCKFLQENPTVFHAVSYFKDKMIALGYKELPARDDWAGKLEPGGKYFVTRNGSSIIGFTVGKAYRPGNGVAIIAGHIDALTAKLKPISKKPTKSGYVQLGVAPYAGALNETWWDRDLSIGGRVIVRDESGKTSSKLVKLDWPIARIPTLAPHFGVGMLGQNNKETEAVPIIGLDNSDIYSSDPKPVETLGPVGSFAATQPPRLVQLISKELRIQDYSQIVDWELELFDVQLATVGGMDREFIFAGRIDDKLCSWAAFQGLLASETNEDDGVIKLVALFDDEEIGSLLRQGARGNFLPSTIERAVEALSGAAGKGFGPGVLGQTYARSFLVSADVTHAANPNFAGRYLEEHAPRLNVGITICGDSNGHLTTDSVSTAVLRRVCELSGCTAQAFQIRNDSRSGGTVGPMLSSALGVKAADAGMAQLSMHSIRATCGALDPGLGAKFFKGFLDRWEKVDGEWQ